ncbi:MAG TPA: hypothetical protein PLA50_02585 [Bacteroidia bacterium]|nr:hypothetical protein [Bacteroidia bacterium]
MKQTSLLRNAFVRLALGLLGAVLLVASVGCQLHSDPGLDSIQFKLDAIGDSFLDLQKQTGEVAAWQIAAALLVVAAGFALIVGAALGSSARRAATDFHQEGERREDSEEPL